METKQTKQLKIGVLGFGAMGRTHTWAIQNLPFFYGTLPFSATAFGVCTTTQEKSDRIAAEFGFSRATTNEDDLIYDPEINVIDICTPNVYHFETLKKAIPPRKRVKYLQFRCMRDKCLEWSSTIVGWLPSFAQSNW